MRPYPKNPDNVSKAEYIDWIVRLFDQKKSGFTQNSVVENIIDLMFSSDDAEPSGNVK